MMKNICVVLFLTIKQNSDKINIILAVKLLFNLNYIESKCCFAIQVLKMHYFKTLTCAYVKIFSLEYAGLLCNNI